MAWSFKKYSVTIQKTAEVGEVGKYSKCLFTSNKLTEITEYVNNLMFNTRLNGKTVTVYEKGELFNYYQF